MRAAIVPAGCALALGLLTACSGGDPKDGGTVTVTVPPSAPAPSSTSASASPSPTPSPVATTLPGTCASLLADSRVSSALGGVDLGQTSYVVGVADTTIGRLSTINCRYGVTGAGAAQKAKIEIGVSLYGTAAQADARITATRDDYVSHGATPTQVQVPSTANGATVTPSATPTSSASSSVTPGGTAAPGAGVPATVLSGGVGDGYTLPLLVAAVDRRTIAVTVDPASVPTAQAAETVAALAIQRTAV